MLLKRHFALPQMPDKPDIDDLIYGQETPAQSEK